MLQPTGEDVEQAMCEAAEENEQTRMTATSGEVLEMVCEAIEDGGGQFHEGPDVLGEFLQNDEIGADGEEEEGDDMVNEYVARFR